MAKVIVALFMIMRIERRFDCTCSEIDLRNLALASTMVNSGSMGGAQTKTHISATCKNGTHSADEEWVYVDGLPLHAKDVANTSANGGPRSRGVAGKSGRYIALQQLIEGKFIVYGFDYVVNLCAWAPVHGCCRNMESDRFPLSFDDAYDGCPACVRAMWN